MNAINNGVISDASYELDLAEQTPELALIVDSLDPRELAFPNDHLLGSSRPVHGLSSCRYVSTYHCQFPKRTE